MVNRIRELLDARQLSPTQFADLIGVGRPVMSHILSERNKPSLEVVQKILDAFPDVSLAWLMKGTGSMQAEAAPATTQAAVPAAAPTPVPPPLVSPARNEPAVNMAAVLPNAAVFAAPVVTQPQSFTSNTAIPTPPVRLASPAPRPLPPRFQPGRAQAPMAAATPAPNVATAEPIAAPVVAPSLPPPASPALAAFPAAIPVFEAAPSPTLPPAPVAYASPAPADVVSSYQPAATMPAPLASTAASQAPPVVPAPVAASTPPTATWAPPAVEVPAVAEASGAEVPVAAPNPAAALSFLGEPGKAIRRIVIFYRDGSFSDYVPEGY